MPKTLRLILGDQLNYTHSWFSKVDKDVHYVLMEMRQETDYVKHHIQKIIGFFSAMRAFSSHLEAAGHQVIYYQLDDAKNKQSLTENLQQLIEELTIEKFAYQLPDEYRLDEQLKTFCQQLSIETTVADTEHFLTQRHELADFFKGKKTYLMESFYRSMRKKYDLMMDGKQPLTGKWNYDKENRKKLPKDHVPTQPFLFERDVTDIYEMIQATDIQTIGKVNPKAFLWPINRTEALELLTFFNENCLHLFGTYQDAMTPNYWSLYHSRLSFSLNTKILSPLEVVLSAISYWQAHPDKISIAQIEGFIRQIIGWREYMRGIYWENMPTYRTLNFFENKRPLPSFFWDGQTKMNCLKCSIGQSLEYAYAHHIQRLMVTGSFTLLAGIHPDAVDEWYLGIYIDALEWVEITNTRGMSQFADGGIVGTKPYAGSANYIDKMSHYCSTCFYKKKEKTGAKACPFNSLYWHFYDRNRAKLEKNPRIGMAYRIWDKMDAAKKEAILLQAETYLENINSL
ncbi:MAG: cryptochrome/photolyase family protein [Saprospiraceae bacterium]